MPWLWIGFLALIVALLVLDLVVLQRRVPEPTLRQATLWTVGWVSLGLSFSGVVWLLYSGGWEGAAFKGGATQLSPGQAVVQYLTGYLLEESLSIDNLFVIAMLFDGFRIDKRNRRRVLFWGIVGAVVMRGVMIAAGVWLVQRFDWIFYVFGGWLALTGLKLFSHSEEEVDAEASLAMRLARRSSRVSLSDHGQHFLVRIDGKLMFTRLAIALLAIELTDVVFALDSIPAVLAITTDPFLVFSSNIFAILGLRSLYFVLQGFMGRFRHLRYALAFILIFIGAKMLLHSVLKIPNLVSLAVILGSVTLSVFTSSWAQKRLRAGD
jgi:tellurite resistance protein TerC